MKQGRIFTEVDVELLLEQVLNGLRFLKNHLGIIHRDIKPQNILIVTEGIYCLTDFGISKSFERDLNTTRIPTRFLETVDFSRGTEMYFAPEIMKVCKLYVQGLLRLEEQDRFVFNAERCDIFSLGLTCLQILNGFKPTQLNGLNSENGE